jgi:hypothetical protein
MLRVDTGWRLDGTAVFVDADGPARLHYVLELAPTWETRSATVRGFIGAAEVDVAIVRKNDGWTFNGEHIGLAHLVDLDCGFTPATNLQHLRRVGLQPGQEADIDVAWLDDKARTVSELPQHYRREGLHTYRYDSPTTDYHEVLEMSPTSGFVRVYPGLWELERD